MKQLLIGPRKFKKSNITGGEVILFENWINYCIKNNHSFDVIDANKGNYPNIIIDNIIATTIPIASAVNPAFNVCLHFLTPIVPKYRAIT